MQIICEAGLFAARHPEECFLWVVELKNVLAPSSVFRMIWPAVKGNHINVIGSYLPVDNAGGIIDQSDDWAQDCSNSGASAMELL